MLFRINMEAESEFCMLRSDYNSVSSVEEFDKICRCCLSPENICSIFEVLYDDEKNFSNLLHSYTSIHVRILLIVLLQW